MQPSLLIVPLLAFNSRMHRVGYGGGYYDATMRNLRKSLERVECVGVGFREMEMEFGGEAHDERMDCVVTDAGVLAI
jgi:5-formyltetrahydrofolate cyclo-ligase